MEASEELSQDIKALVEESNRLLDDLIQRHGMTEAMLLINVTLARVLRQGAIDDTISVKHLGMVLSEMWLKERKA